MKVNYVKAIATLKKSDPILAALIDRVGACQLDQAQRQGDLLATLVRAIIGQQLSTKVAKTIHQRLIDYYQGALDAAAMLTTPDEDLRSIGLSRQKIIYVKDLAQRIQTDLPSIEQLSDWDDDSIIATLTQVKGIGKWTVQMLLIFRLHRWDVLPVDDLGIRTGFQRTYDLAELPDKKAIAQYGERWSPYRSIAAWYLWRSLENLE